MHSAQNTFCIDNTKFLLKHFGENKKFSLLFSTPKNPKNTKMHQCLFSPKMSKNPPKILPIFHEIFLNYWGWGILNFWAFFN